MTQYYIGVKIIQAWEQERDGQPGYGVKYEDGYTSWSPKDTFERAYFPMGESNHNKVTEKMVEKLSELKNLMKRQFLLKPIPYQDSGSMKHLHVLILIILI